MGIRKLVVRVGLCMMLLATQLGVHWQRAWADAASPQLVISEFKVSSSDSQYFKLYNAGSTSINLGGYQLEYFNNNDLTKATSTKLIALSGTLPAGGYYLLNDSTMAICYQMVVQSVSLGFSTTSGFVELLQLPQQTSAGTLMVPSVTDYVGWSKKTSSGKDTATVTPAGNTVTTPSTTAVSWLRQRPVAATGSGSWQAIQPSATDACAMQVVQTGTIVDGETYNPGNQLTVGEAAPATIVSLASDDSAATASAPSLPAADVGLAAPQITELLPNPTGTGNDDLDEYIELYNPNAVSFDLTGFTLQTGNVTKHKYVFPAGTLLSAKGFTAFYSSDTGLSLSNTTSVAELLDPFGNSLAKTDAYTNAKDGQAWAFAKSWYWTAQPTPGSANVIKQSGKASKTNSTSAAAKKTSSGHVLGAATTASNASADDEGTGLTPLHPLVLAVVAILAVGYGIYEYRHDLANRILEFRRNRAARRAHR